MSVKLTVEAFFTEKLNTTIPMLSGIDEIYRNEGVEAAERAFATFIREGGMLRDDFFFRDKDSTPSEKDFEEGERIIDGWLTSVEVSMQFPGRDVDWTANPTFNKYCEWTWQLARHPEWQTLGKLYRATGDERYTEAFVDYLISFYEGTEPPEFGTSGFHTLSWRSLEAAIRLEQSWPEAIFSFYKSPALSDHAITVFFMGIYDNINRVLHAQTSHNWLVTELSGVSTTALSFPFFAESEEWEAYAIRRLTEELHAQVYPDYFQHEMTTGYHMVVLRTYMGIMNLHKRFETPLPDSFRLLVANLFRLYIRLMMPDRLTPGTNDGGRVNVVGVCRQACETFPELYEEFSYIAYGEGKEPPFRSIMMPYSGFGIMRSGWGEDDVCAILESAPFGKAHQHEDKLEVMLHAYRKQLLEDMGSYAYDTSAMRQHILSSYSHNVAIVDGEGQCRRNGYCWHPEDINKLADIRSEFGEDIEWVEGVYDWGFGMELIPVTHTRRLIWFKNGQGEHKAPFWVVLDRFEPKDDKEHDYTLLWHLMPGTNPVISGTNIDADYGDGIHFHLVGMTEPHIVEGQKEPLFIGWRPIHGPGDHEHRPAPTAMYTYRGKDVTVATLLYPTPEGCPFTKIEFDENGEIRLT